MEPPTPFGITLKQLRESRGLTQEQLAERAGLTRNAIAALERGRRQRPYPHTLRALTDALGLSQVEQDTLRSGVRPADRVVAPPSTAATQLVPGALTPLFGRERDVALVQTRFTSGATRLITLTGPGGVGKTRLALELATQMRSLVPDGVTVVELAALSDPALIIPTIAHTLGLRDTGDRSVRTALHAHLATKQAMIVLDNVEHLLDGAADIAALLAACPALCILATSRIPLRVRGEHEYTVEPLAVPDPAQAPTAAMVRAAPAATLFVTRAQAVQTAFVLSERNAAAVAAICWRLDGLPLAIELVAAQARFLGPTALLARLDQVLRTSGARDLPARQQTMRATLDWSYQLLSEGEQRLFQRLAVCVGGFTLAAAEAIGSAEDMDTDAVLGLLGRLVEQSLVTVRVDDEDEDEARYSMLEPIRHYARDHLGASGALAPTRARHAAFYERLTAQAGVELQHADQGLWLERLQREHANVRAALAWLLEHGAAAQVAQIGWSIWRFWSFRGQVGDGLYWMERVRDGTIQLPPAVQAMATAVQGMLEFARGRIDHTATLLDASVAAARAAGDDAVYAAVRTLQGLAQIANNHVADAEAILTEAVAVCRTQGNPTFTVYGLSGLAQVAFVNGDIAQTTALNAEGEAIARAAGDWSMLTAMLIIQAVVARSTGDVQRATVRLRESIELSTTLNDVWSLVLSATTLAGLLVAHEQFDQAAQLFGAVEAWCATTGVEVSWSVWREQRTKDILQVQAHLDTTRFATRWAAGRTMALDHAIAEVWLCLPH